MVRSREEADRLVQNLMSAHASQLGGAEAEIDEAVPADRARRVHTKQLKPLLGWLRDFRGTHDERAHQIG